MDPHEIEGRLAALELVTAVALRQFGRHYWGHILR